MTGMLWKTFHILRDKLFAVNQTVSMSVYLQQTHVLICICFCRSRLNIIFYLPTTHVLSIAIDELGILMIVQKY